MLNRSLEFHLQHQRQLKDKDKKYDEMKKQHRLKLKPKEGKFLTRALGSDVRGTQSILHVVYFAAHRLICSLVCWLSRTKESGLNVSKDE